MKTRFVVLAPLLAALAAAPLSAEGLSVTTGGGVLVGVSQELVYDWSLASPYIVSELDWQLAPVYLWSAELAWSSARGLAMSVKLQAGLPLRSGIIEDSDWLNFDDAHTKTHYSRHDNYTEQAFLADARMGWRFALGTVSLEPFLAFGLMHFKFTARDGYLQYPPESYPGPYTPWSSSTAQIPVYGTGIAYQQDWFIPAAGLDGSLSLGGRASLSARLVFSPAVFCYDLDNHLMTGRDYTEAMAGGIMLEPGAGFTWAFTDRLRLSADVSYRWISRTVGDVLILATGVGSGAGSTASVSNAGGAAYGALGASLLLTVTP
jgi:outer membrane protease